MPERGAAARLPVAPAWFTRDAVAPGVLRLTEPHLDPLIRANLFFVEGRECALLVDSGMGVGRLRSALPLRPGKPLVVFTTHAHVDHIGGHHEFPEAEVLVHAAEAPDLRDPPVPRGLGFDHFDPASLAGLAAMGFRTEGLLLEALPEPDFRPDDYHCRGVEPTRLVADGDRLDIGGRRFDILHLPGHSPGGLALWEAATGILFSGDTLYDGLLLDTIPGASIRDLAASLIRLRRDIPARLVLGGHRDPIDGGRMAQVIDTYLAYRRGHW